ncbi:MAG: HEAT repeat domain-containing protein [Candidatus Kariarchaeaceae archaeon]
MYSNLSEKTIDELKEIDLLKERGEEGIGQLLELARSESSEAKEKAIWAVVDQEISAAHKKELITIFQEASPTSFKESITLALGQILDADIEQILIDAIKKEPSPDVRSAIINSLSYSSSEEAKQLITETVQTDPDSLVRLNSAWKIKSNPLGFDTVKLIDVVLKDTNEEVRRIVLAALIIIGSKKVVPAMSQIVTDWNDHYQVRLLAASSLGRFKLDDNQPLNDYASVLKNEPNIHLQIEAAKSLAFKKDVRAFDYFAELLNNSESVSETDQTIDALFGIRRLGYYERGEINILHRIRTILENSKDVYSQEERIAAAITLGFFKGEESLEVFFSTFKEDEDEVVRWYCGLELMTFKKEQVKDRLLQLLNFNDELYYNTLALTAFICGKFKLQDAIEPIVELLYDEESEEVSYYALKALQNFTSEDLLEIILDEALNSPTEGMRAEAVKQLIERYRLLPEEQTETADKIKDTIFESLLDEQEEVRVESFQLFTFLNSEDEYKRFFDDIEHEISKNLIIELFELVEPRKEDPTLKAYLIEKRNDDTILGLLSIWLFPDEEFILSEWIDYDITHTSVVKEVNLLAHANHNNQIAVAHLNQKILDFLTHDSSLVRYLTIKAMHDMNLKRLIMINDQLADDKIQHIQTKVIKKNEEWGNSAELLRLYSLETTEIEIKKEIIVSLEKIGGEYELFELERAKDEEFEQEIIILLDQICSSMSSRLGLDEF